MKRVTKIALAVGLALGAAAVLAQPYGMTGGGIGGMGMMGRGMMGGAMMGGGYDMQDRLAAQKSALKITAEQERAWATYAELAKQQLDTMQARHEALWTSSADRYQLHSKLMKESAVQHEAVAAAYKELYGVLTPEQRAVADQRGGCDGGWAGMRSL